MMIDGDVATTQLRGGSSWWLLRYCATAAAVWTCMWYHVVWCGVSWGGVGCVLVVGHEVRFNVANVCVFACSLLPCSRSRSRSRSDVAAVHHSHCATTAWS